jgi:hypothetical protein
LLIKEYYSDVDREKALSIFTTLPFLKELLELERKLNK